MDQRRDAFSIVFDKFCAISCSYSICEHKHECQGHCEAAHMFSVWFFYSLSNACVCNIVLVLSPASEQGLYTVASLLVRHQDSQTFECLIISKHSCPVCVCARTDSCRRWTEGGQWNPCGWQETGGNHSYSGEPHSVVWVLPVFGAWIFLNCWMNPLV